MQMKLNFISFIFRDRRTYKQIFKLKTIIVNVLFFESIIFSFFLRDVIYRKNIFLCIKVEALKIHLCACNLNGWWCINWNKSLFINTSMTCSLSNEIRNLEIVQKDEDKDRYRLRRRLSNREKLGFFYYSILIHLAVLMEICESYLV